MMKRRPWWVMIASFAMIAGLALGCGAGETAAEEGSNAEGASVAAEASADAAPKGTPIDNDRFSTILPADWEIMNDSIEKMGMMTLAKKDTRGKTGVYLKFEGSGNYSGDPMKQLNDFAAGHDGTPAEAVTINGIEWAATTYEAYGSEQTMYVTSHNGTKVTATVLGGADSPGAKTILGSFELK